MSLKQLRSKPPYYRLRVDENLLHYIYRLIRSIIKMRSSVRVYGIRYYFNHDYRMYCIYKRRKCRENAVRRKRQGRYFRKHRWEIKSQLIERDGKICNHCRQPFLWQQLTFDHIIRLGAGETSLLENLQLLCVPCHEAKTRQEHILLNEVNFKTTKPYLNR